MRQVDALVCYVVHVKELAAWYATLLELLLRVAFAYTAATDSVELLTSIKSFHSIFLMQRMLHHQAVGSRDLCCRDYDFPVGSATGSKIAFA